MVATKTTCVANPRESYQWVWAVTNVEPASKNECPPMEKGDRLFICVDPDCRTRFFHRTVRDPQNTPLWDNACAILCEKTGVIVGTFSDGRTFKMTIAEGANGTQITCNHRRNPDEGTWIGIGGTDPV